MTTYFGSRAPIFSVPPAGGGLKSARFLVELTGEHNTAGLSGDDNTVIKWDSTPEFDDLGFPSDYWEFSGGFFVPSAGDYLITVFAALEPDSAFTTGSFLLDIDTGVSSVNSKQGVPVTADNPPKASASTVYRFGAGDSFLIRVHTFGVDDTSTIGTAAVTITKLT